MKKLSYYTSVLAGALFLLLLSGGLSNAYAQSVFYQTHVSWEGWHGWTSNGNSAGHIAADREIEAIRVNISGFSPLTSIRYRVHVQDVGWQNYVADGAQAGTTGASKQIEAIIIDLVNNPHGYLEYSVWISGIGWSSWVREGNVAGTTGQGRAIQALRVRFVNVETWVKVEEGTYTIQSHMIDKNLDIQWGVNGNGVGLHLWPVNNDVAQQFTITESPENGYYYIRTVWGRALEIYGSDRSSGARLNTWDFHGGDNQKWRFIAVGGGYYNIQSKLGTYIDLAWGNTADGAPIHMSGYSTWGSNTAQRWRISRILPTFKHIAGSTGSHVTALNHETTNFHDHALLFVTSDYGSSGVYNTSSVGVWYNGSKWTIFNQDFKAMPNNATFNVMVSEPRENAYMHTATASTISGHITYLNHPMLNNNPKARLLVTQNWGSSGPYNKNPVGVYYTGTQWAIFNQNWAAMPVNAKFNILISDLLFETVASSPSFNWTTINDVRTNGVPHRMVFSTQLWEGVYNPHEIGVWYNASAARWTVYNQDRVNMHNNARFFVLATTALPGIWTKPEDANEDKDKVAERGETDLDGLEVKTYPNPVTERLFVNLPKSADNEAFVAQIWDATGRCVLQGTKWAAAQRQEVDVSTWQKGVYRLQLTTAAGTKQTVSFVKAN